MDVSNLPESKVTDYTVTHSFDTFRNGSKSSHFVSMRFRTDRPVTFLEAEALAMVSSLTVTKAVIYHALARGALKIDEANDMISYAKDNHERIYEQKFLPLLEGVK